MPVKEALTSVQCASICCHFLSSPHDLPMLFGGPFLVHTSTLLRPRKFPFGQGRVDCCPSSHVLAISVAEDVSYRHCCLPGGGVQLSKVPELIIVSYGSHSDCFSMFRHVVASTTIPAYAMNNSQTWQIFSLMPLIPPPPLR